MILLLKLIAEKSATTFADLPDWLLWDYLQPNLKVSHYDVPFVRTGY